MYKVAGLLIAATLMFFGAAGCSESRRSYVTNVAPTATYSVTYIDSFSSTEQQELRDSIAAILSELRLQNPSVVFNVTINVTKTHINNHPKGRNILAFCGEDNECPDLYDRLCKLLLSDYDKDAKNHKEKGRRVENENRRRNRH